MWQRDELHLGPLSVLVAHWATHSFLVDCVKVNKFMKFLETFEGISSKFFVKFIEIGIKILKKVKKIFKNLKNFMKTIKRR